MTHRQIEEFLLSFPEAWLDYPFGKGVAVYKTGKKQEAKGKKGAGGNPSTGSGQARMFALISETDTPLRLSLKCDPQLAILLRQKYETVLPGYHLNKKHWNTIVCSGQLPDAEIFDLARHSWELVK